MYKKIIENIVNLELSRKVEKQAERFHMIDVNEIVLKKQEGFPHPVFAAVVRVLQNAIISHDYNVHGFVDNYGTVVPSSINFERTYYNRKTEKEYTNTYFIHGDEIDTFKFDF